VPRFSLETGVPSCQLERAKTAVALFRACQVQPLGTDEEIHGPRKRGATHTDWRTKGLVVEESR
jgi:hypothetical protein